MNCIDNLIITKKRNTKFDYKKSKLKHYVEDQYIEDVLYFIFYVNVLWLSINQATLPLSLLCYCTLTYCPFFGHFIGKIKNLNLNLFPKKLRSGKQKYEPPAPQR